MITKQLTKLLETKNTINNILISDVATPVKLQRLYRPVLELNALTETVNTKEIIDTKRKMTDILLADDVEIPWPDKIIELYKENLKLGDLLVKEKEEIEYDYLANTDTLEEDEIIPSVYFVDPNTFLINPAKEILEGLNRPLDVTPHINPVSLNEAMSLNIKSFSLDDVVAINSELNFNELFDLGLHYKKFGEYPIEEDFDER